MTWTILTTAVCAAWLVYEYRTAPIESTDGLTGNDCQCHGSKGIDSNHEGELRRATEGKANGRFRMDSHRNSGGFRGCRIGRVDCVARHRGSHWEVGLFNGKEKWMWSQRVGRAVRLKVAKLATAGHLTWEEAAGVNAFLLNLETESCKSK